ncbi:hypothetical protein P7C71_g2266, partial [Lecanoromycetidae sp. Uapishka_2]
MCSLPGMQAMCQDNTRALVGIGAALLVLATTAVILRLASRRMSALTFWWDDVAIIASLVLYTICITLVKLSILLFYYRLFGVRKTFRRVIVAALALVITWCIAIVLLNILQCIPIQAAWIRPYPHSKCLNNNTSLLGTAITNVVIDLAILVLPIEPIWRLNLTLRKKLALTTIFCIGAFICAAAMIRVWAIRNIDQTDVTWSYVRPLTWSAVEISIGITCACLPILQPLLQATFGSCFGRAFHTSHDTGKSNAYASGGKQISGGSHARPQMARRTTSDYSRFGPRQAGTYLHWGKFFDYPNKDKEANAGSLNDHTFASNRTFEFASSGRADAISGTEGQVDIIHGNDCIFQRYRDCPWSGSNKLNAKYVANGWYPVVPQISTSGALGTVTIKRLHIGK